MSTQGQIRRGTIHSFMHSATKKCLLMAYNAPGAVLGVGGEAVPSYTQTDQK